MDRTRSQRRTKLATKFDKKLADDEFMAAATGDVEWLKQSLRNKGGTVNYDKNGLAPIHLSAIHGRIDCLKFLIEKQHVDVNMGSSTGWRPVHLAISNQTGKRSLQCLLYLLDKGADPSVVNDDNITPLHQAASEGHVQCLKALIEVGAKVDSEDYRGHKPLDLAKLWGHRKCARILAAEMWHRDKDLLTKELHQLQKLKTQQLLQEMEQDETDKFDQQFYGELAYRNWLQEKGLAQDTGSVEVQPNTTKQIPKGYVANSVRPTSRDKARSQSPDRSPIQDYEYKTPNNQVNDNSGLNVQNSPDISLETEHSQRPSRKLGTKPEIRIVNHEHPWDISTHLPPPEYVPKLPDYYPRDEYSMQPKYPLKKWGIPSPNFNMIPIRHENTSTKAKLRKPKLPPEMLDKLLQEDHGLHKNPTVYKCKNITDVQKLKQFNSDNIPKAEAALHMCDDISSRLFSAALQKPLSIYSDSDSSFRTETIRSLSHQL